MCSSDLIGFGRNKYEDTETIVSELLSPFYSQSAKDKLAEEKRKEKESQEEDEEEETTLKSKSNTLGRQLVLNKAQILFDVTINPYQYKEYMDVIEGFNGYEEEDYIRFKKASIKGISNLNSKSKKGCTNDFALFVETKDEIKDHLDLNCLSDLITVKEDEDTMIYDISNLEELFNEEDIKEKIKSIEIYIDPYNLKLQGKIENVKIFNIRTEKELSEKEIDRCLKLVENLKGEINGGN